MTIAGGEGLQFDLEVDPLFDQALATDARRSGSHAVWSTAVDLAVSMVETAAALSFVPPDLAVTTGTAYNLALDNPAGNDSKHYYMAAEFYRTLVLRKAVDNEAEIKAPYLKAVELLIGGSTTLFMVPTTAGTYGVVCTIVGHVAAGMTG